MLDNLLSEIENEEVIVIDDGSEYSSPGVVALKSFSHTMIRTHHEGKQGFWKKWVLARQLALGTDHEYFLFLPDDFSDIQLEKIKEITEQGWEDRLFAMTIVNGGDQFRWGEFKTGQEPIEISGTTFRECCFVDGSFLTNRRTLEHCDIHEVPLSWFDHKHKSSGVGFQMTMTLRKMGAIMMRPDKSLAYHGDHESKMHKQHRELNPLITK